MENITFKGEKLPLVGFGTWCIGDDENKAAQEMLCMQTAINDYGMTLIDTAEMYGNGKAENIVGEVMKTIPRDKIFLVDKILPENAKASKYRECVLQSLKRTNCDYFDLYLLHWREDVNLQNMVDEMGQLVQEGLIRHWGVSNFDVNDMEDLFACKNGNHCFANQILYNITARGVEYDLLPWCKEHNVLIMVYSPLGNVRSAQMNVAKYKEVADVCCSKNITVTNMMLRFVVRNKDLVALFKTSSLEHLDDNLFEIEQGLTEEDLEKLNKCFNPPTEKVPLEKI